MANYEQLFTPFKIGNVEIKNRITLAPMGGGQLGGNLIPAGKEQIIPADALVWAVGFKPVDILTRDLQKAQYQCWNIRDSKSVANIHQAVWDGYEIGRYI